MCYEDTYMMDGTGVEAPTLDPARAKISSSPFPCTVSLLILNACSTKNQDSFL